jgi:predicted house-cleaning noncanonical NTP pyrophosphatase (MazG superfamily)
MAYYNRLVRDKIPELLEQAGKKGTFRLLDEKEYASELKKKLSEGVKEYRETECDSDAAEQLSCLLEIIDALISVHKRSPGELEKIREEKARKYGKFQQRLFLIKVED